MTIHDRRGGMFARMVVLMLMLIVGELAAAVRSAAGMRTTAPPANEQQASRSAEQKNKPSLTVPAAIESAKLLQMWQMEDGSPNKSPVLLSPDGTRYVAAVSRGDLRRNENELTLWVGEITSLNAAQPKAVARLFTADLSEIEATNVANRLQWFPDNEHVALMWTDEHQLGQVMSVNVRTGRAQTVARHREGKGIRGYSLSADGSTLLYLGWPKTSTARSLQMMQEGFVLTDTKNRLPLLAADLDPHPWYRFELFVFSLSNGSTRQIPVHETPGHIFPEFMQLSPNGRYAFVNRFGIEIPESWERYTGEGSMAITMARKQNARTSQVVSQLSLIDAVNATYRPLWNAPTASFAQAFWSPDSRSVAVGPTFLPPDTADSSGLTGKAFAVVDVQMGKYEVLPVPRMAASRQLRLVRWRTDGTVQLTDWNDPKFKLYFQWRTGQWRAVHPAASVERLRFELHQDLNTTPILYAIETASGRKSKILDLNPQLQQYALGRVEMIRWKDKQGRAYTGRLYYPAHYRKGQRYPLVIQTHGFAPETEFSLLGHDDMTSAFAAQPLAGRDIAVLHVADVPDGEFYTYMGTREEGDTVVAGYEGAIDHLVSVGLIERNKVGLVGWSRTGYHVEYAITFSKFRFAAAIAADNVDGNYLQRVVFDLGDMDSVIGARPFGEGLTTWLQRSPAFNVEKIHTPLRMERDNGGLRGLIGRWEMLSRLNELSKPVELHVVPDIERGRHALRNPRQQLASQGGTVDWFDFWLNGRERTEPYTAAGETKERLAEQYARWRKLRELHEADLTTVQPGRYAQPR